MRACPHTIVLPAILAAAALAAAAGPRLSFETAACDFGELAPLAKTGRTLSITNGGDATARIIRVTACCGVSAAVSPMTLSPGGTAELGISFTPGTRPGPFRKTVSVLTDDPALPVCNIVLTGTVSASRPVEGGGMVRLAPVPGGNPASPAAPASLKLTAPAVLISGFADGFNPCAFSVAVFLAGALAVGRGRRARILGGWAFCAASFATYVLMGFGLLEAFRAFPANGLIRNALFAALSLTLLALSLLSFRDAARYGREGTPDAVALKLPERARRAIRSLAGRCWGGPSVIGAGLACGFVVTLLDALCTGQVYVPVLAMLARDSGSARAAALLALYNLAFIAPLVAVFLLAAYGAGAERMVRWAKRDVVPAKVLLGAVFALLAVLLWPRAMFPGDGRKAVASPDPRGAATAAAPESADAPPARVSGIMSPADLAAANERLDALLRKTPLDPGVPRELAATVRDRGLDRQWRNYCLQIVPECMLRLDRTSSDYLLLRELLSEAVGDRGTILSGTALLGLQRLSEATGDPPPAGLADLAASIAADPGAARENRITALRVGAGLGATAMLEPARYWARHGESEFLRCAAVSVIRDLGTSEDTAFVRSLLPARTRREADIIGNTLKRLEGRE